MNSKYLNYQPVNHVPGHICQTKIPALKPVGQFRMINAHLMQNGGVQVMHVDSIFGDVVSKFIRFSVSQARLESAARYPHAERARMMIASQEF